VFVETHPDLNLASEAKPRIMWKGEDGDTGRIEFDEHHALDKKKERVLMDMASRQKLDAA
jgi:hypothetical protein